MSFHYSHIIEKRALRHILFWLCWILGFTFIKSFGETLQAYVSWFFYYIITLPVFIAHTYIVVYFLIPKFGRRKQIPVFILLFLALFYGFSVLELLLSNEFIFRVFPAGSEVEENYLDAGNVIINGLGNLYIVLVFLASKTIRDWSKSTLKKQELQQGELKEQMEETMIKVQPLMLIYAIDHIDRMVEDQRQEVSDAIARTSELLSELMMYYGEGEQWLSREIELVKKLVDLVAIFRGRRPEVEFFISGDPGKVDLPPMILFSFVDMFFRNFDAYEQIPDLNIEVIAYSDMISLQILKGNEWWKDERIASCMKAISWLEQKCGGRVKITKESHNYGCSVVIRAIHTVQEEEHPRVSAAG